MSFGARIVIRGFKIISAAHLSRIWGLEGPPRACKRLHVRENQRSRFQRVFQIGLFSSIGGAPAIRFDFLKSQYWHYLGSMSVYRKLELPSDMISERVEFFFPQK